MARDRWALLVIGNGLRPAGGGVARLDPRYAPGRLAAAASPPATRRGAGKASLPISRSVTPGSDGIRRLKSGVKLRLLVHQGWGEQFQTIHDLASS